MFSSSTHDNKCLKIITSCLSLYVKMDRNLGNMSGNTNERRFCSFSTLAGSLSRHVVTRHCSQLCTETWQAMDRPQIRIVQNQCLTTFKNSGQLIHKQADVLAYRNASVQRTIPLWNQLPDSVVIAPSLDVFKRRLNHAFLP